MPYWNATRPTSPRMFRARPFSTRARSIRSIRLLLQAMLRGRGGPILMRRFQARGCLRRTASLSVCWAVIALWRTLRPLPLLQPRRLGRGDKFFMHRWPSIAKIQASRDGRSPQLRFRHDHVAEDDRKGFCVAGRCGRRAYEHLPDPNRSGAPGLGNSTTQRQLRPLRKGGRSAWPKGGHVERDISAELERADPREISQIRLGNVALARRRLLKPVRIKHEKANSLET